MASWRKGTKVQYQTYFSKWIKWCTEKSCNPLTAPISAAIDFLASLYDLGYSYSSIDTAKSALSSLLQTDPPFGQQPLVKLFMKGIFELKLSLPCTLFRYMGYKFCLRFYSQETRITQYIP